MKKYAVVSVVVVLFIFASLVSVLANDIIWDDIGRENLNLRTVLVSPDNPRIIYIGSTNAVLKSEDGAGSWRNILSIKGQNKAVNFLLFDPKDKNCLYAATGNGLFYSSDDGRNWGRVFKGKDYLENECTALAVLPYGIYLGTKSGLFVSKDQGRSWHKQTVGLGNSHILTIAYHPGEPNNIYLACANGAFKSEDSGQSWKRIFIAHPKELANDEEMANEESEEKEQFSDIRYLVINPNNASYLYLATNRGVYRSQDRGLNWEPLSSFGLLNQKVRFLLISSQSHLYAVSESGIFAYLNERWQEVSLGLPAQDTNFLTLDKQDNLYAAGNRGLFKANLGYVQGSEGQDTITLYSQGEPDINEVQQAAVKYAEVEPEKILRWRKECKMRAILPKLTIGIDKSERTNYEIYTSATTHYVFEGPRDSSGGWDITLSWELGDLIWSDDQTNIDVRSKLMVQLRDDILDEVTKLYFERLRVKIELGRLSIEDRKKRLEKELKIRELTAMLDALTGGHFSQQIKTKTGS